MNRSYQNCSRLYPYWAHCHILNIPKYRFISADREPCFWMRWHVRSPVCIVFFEFKITQLCQLAFPQPNSRCIWTWLLYCIGPFCLFGSVTFILGFLLSTTFSHPFCFISVLTETQLRFAKTIFYPSDP